MAISRHINLRKYVDSNRKVNYQTFPFVKKELLYNEKDFIIKINENERLDTLALKYLGDGRYWWAICMLNDIKLPFGDELYTGRLIRIPNSIDDLLKKIERYNK